MPSRAEGTEPPSPKIESRRLEGLVGGSLINFLELDAFGCVRFFESAEGVLHEHGNGHGTDATRNGRDVTGARRDGIVINVPDEAVSALGFGVFNAVDPDVDNGDSVFDHVGRHEVGTPDGGDEEIGLAGDGREVLSARMADGDGGVAGKGFAHHEQGGRFADDLAAPEHDYVFAFGLDAAAVDEFYDSCGGAGDKSVGVFLAEFPDVDGVESVDVFVGGDSVKSFGFVEVFGKGGLNEDAVDLGVSIEGINGFKERGFGDVFGQEMELAIDSDAGGGLFFFAHVRNGGRVIAHANESGGGFERAV